MSLPTCKELLLEQKDGALFITLNRPHKRNAMNSAMVSEIMERSSRQVAEPRRPQSSRRRDACRAYDLSKANDTKSPVRSMLRQPQMTALAAGATEC